VDVDGYDFSIGLGDNNVLWQFPVYEPDGVTPFDPHGAASVTLHTRIDDDSDVAHDLTGAVFAQAIRPDWVGRSMQAADFASAGVFLVQAIIVMVTGDRLTYPSNRKMRVLVEGPA